jgi:hypothetical protein
LIVHHSGWQDGEGARKRERGSSAWRGNGDGTVYLEVVAGEPPDDVELSLRTIKARDAGGYGPLTLIRRTVTIPGEFDTFGRPATSCIIVADARTTADRAAAAAEADAERHRPIDIKLLKTVRDHTVTSGDQLRRLSRLGSAAAKAAVDRLVDAGLLREPSRKQQPFQLTEAGAAALVDHEQERIGLNRTKSDSRIAPNNRTPHPPIGCGSICDADSGESHSEGMGLQLDSSNRTGHVRLLDGN